MKTFETSVSWIKPDSALVGFLEVMADMEETGSLECVTKVANLRVRSGQTCEPIIGNTN